ncbi:MAG: hypothetical protein KAU02_03205 [Tenericutes bacterium]|nr:hypothetical protein [Mycoplasmatota bacterium]
MIEMIKFQYKFLFNRMTIIIVFIFNIILFIGLLYSSSIFEGYYYIDLYRESFAKAFNTEAFLLIKVASVMISVILTTMIYSDTNNNLSKYIIDKEERKFIVFFSRIYTLMFVMSIIIIVYFLDYLVITILLTPYIFDLVYISKITFWLIVQVYIYVALTGLLTTLVPNILISLIPIALFWFLEINAQEEVILQSNILKIMYEYIPNLVEIDSRLTVMGNLGKYLVFLIIVISGNCLYYVKKDII